MNLSTLDEVRQLILAARREDLGPGDVTAALMPEPDRTATFQLLGKEAGVLAGVALAPLVLETYDPTITIRWAGDIQDSAAIPASPTVLATITGPLGTVLSAERVLLNFLQRLSGIASATRRFVEAVAGTEAEIFDTRKTTPGWRVLEKYAVACGGGRNHRAGLFDAVLIKDNHIADVDTADLAQAVAGMIGRMRTQGMSPDFVQVEADTLDQARRLFEVEGVDSILLDNFSIADMTEAVRLRNDAGLRGKLTLEASGGITLSTVGTIASTGVDRISVGAITHSATSLDLSLERVSCS